MFVLEAVNLAFVWCYVYETLVIHFGERIDHCLSRTSLKSSSSQVMMNTFCSARLVGHSRFGDSFQSTGLKFRRWTRDQFNNCISEVFHERVDFLLTLFSSKGMVGCIVQLFYSRRVHILINRWWLTSVITVSAIAHLGMSFYMYGFLRSRKL